MSRYSLSDDSGGFNNRVYKIAVIIFMLVLLVKSCAEPQGDGSQSLIIIVSLVFIILLFFFINHRETNLMEKNDGDAEFFGSLLESGEYFSAMDWQFKYRQYIDNIKPHHLSSLGLSADLSLRYIKKVLRRDFYIPLLIFPLVGGTFAAMLLQYVFPDASFAFLMFCLTAAQEIPYFAILYLLSLRFLKTWIEKHPRYKNSMKEISTSYASGDAYECSYFCLVIGPKYVHGFDGEKFHTVLRENITSCTWDIERLVIYVTGKYGERYVCDEYRFSIMFNCDNADRGNSFKITLDQFQIKMIMEKYFPDISSDENPTFTVTKTYGHRVSSLKNHASGPVL